MTGPVVIAAGGTGGHFFPAEALAEALIARGVRVALMTDARSGGQNAKVFSGSECFVLPGAGIAGRGVIRAARAGISLSAGVLQARRIHLRLRPSAIVAFGGYPSVAPVLGGWLSGLPVPVILHEQNAVLGRANRALSRFATFLALSFANTSGLPRDARTAVTGNPVRPAIASLVHAGFDARQEPFRLLVLGGSLGARVFSDVVPAAIALLPAAARARLAITQQCRAEDMDRVRAAYTALGMAADLAPFFTDIAEHLRAASLVLARAGASTVAELTTIGRPSLLVPLPSAIDDHQTANATALVAAGGAVMIAQPHFTAEDLARELAALLDTPERLTIAAKAAATLGSPDAANHLADLTQRLNETRAA